MRDRRANILPGGSRVHSLDRLTEAERDAIVTLRCGSWGDKCRELGASPRVIDRLVMGGRARRDTVEAVRGNLARLAAGDRSLAACRLESDLVLTMTDYLDHLDQPALLDAIDRLRARVLAARAA